MVAGSLDRAAAAWKMVIGTLRRADALRAIRHSGIRKQKRERIVLFPDP